MSETAIAEKIEPEAEEEKVEKPSPINRSRFGLQVEHNNEWRLNVPVTVTPEQVMDEGYWSLISQQLEPGDEVHVFPDDMTWELVLHVIGAGHNYAHVCKKEFYELAPREDALALPSIYKIEHAGTTLRWRVLREGRSVRDGFASEKLAHQFAVNHEMAGRR